MRPLRTPIALAVGVIVWLASELMFFAALFAAYFSLREITNAAALEAGTTSMWEWGTSHIDNQWFGITYPWFATINTLVLLLSSVTCQLGVHQAEEGRVSRTGSLLNPTTWGLREWYTLTFLMGAFFIATTLIRQADIGVEQGRLAPDTRMGHDNTTTQIIARRLGLPEPALSPDFAAHRQLDKLAVA